MSVTSDSSESSFEMEEAVADPVLLTSTNYNSWKSYIETKQIDGGSKFKRVWGYLYPGPRYSLDLEIDKKVLKEIKLSCSEEMLQHILYAEYFAEAWEWLKEAVDAATEEKERYYNMMEIAIASRAKADEVPEVDKVLTKRNYGKWKNYMKNVLLSKYLWVVVDGSEPIGSRTYRIKNHNALATIRISCGKEMFEHIYEADHAREAWFKIADREYLKMRILCIYWLS
ncbi:hypothetical protein C5167_009949 [Papaver somniferum]|uniref:DUF4219 domain-containing protein n=1 Tax=Papaver somniferum TaxID=3469 RepID=A0A4Y7JYT6_PAPSO|nr:hypothetical protein C5167_009949 [Papaver somniferum]